jgi:hypothetical protein
MRLDQPGLVLGEQREVFHEVQQTVRSHSATEHHFQRHAAWLVLFLNTLPLEKRPQPAVSEPTLAFGAVAGDKQALYQNSAESVACSE